MNRNQPRPQGRHATPSRIGRARRQAAPGPRVIIALLLLLGLISAMLLDGYLRAEVGNDQRVRSGASASNVPDSVLDGGPFLSFEGGTARTRSVPDKTIVLTFDDGPDPEWTEQVLDILDDNDVPGTFFLVGSMISRYPDVVRRMVDDGNEVGVHTFTHVDLSYQSTARVTREIAQTQLALAGAAGITTTLFRAPYSSTSDAIDNYSWPVYKKLGAMGYTSVLIDTDSEDWQQPGVSDIVKWATPKAGKGASVLFHDAGGNRAQTLEALPQYIKIMKSKGYTFTTVSGAQQQTQGQQAQAQAPQGAPGAVGNARQSNPEQSAHRTADTATLWEGRALLGAVAVAEWTVPGLAAVLAVVGVAVLGRFAMMLVLARRHHRQRNGRRFVWGPEVTERVSVIVPAYNEKECIANTLNSLAASTHPIEIVVVDDGSTDGTAEIAESLGLPNVRVIRQANAGKPAALNNGVRHARHGIVVMMDGDTVFEPDTVHRLVQPFGDPALSGTISRDRWVISGRRSRFSNSPEIRLLSSSLTYGMRTGSPVTMHWKNGVCSGKAMDSPTGTVSSQRPGSSLCSTQTRCQTVVTSGGPSGKPSPARTAARRCVPAKSVKRGTAALVTSRMVRSRSREVPMRPLTSLRNSSRSRTAPYSRSSSGRGTARGAAAPSGAAPGSSAGRRGVRRGTPQSGVTGTRSR
ncbi:polysaccharide deacetylase family protein [Streptomyces sp. JH14]|uniref:bifunctional polysaccharide deacetylase/glycosyltransferase family 2 protein n=1 Tax=Streptomyces sp. JH14 TaxID=2793630 RepID=UPI0023F75099|nr:polysaccharide deacetylase family protein [Streptomyces sp. JH14]MDF6046084.1 polysaccharide deacetylase family protein [Streptomyces sp. JH14]